ncbi:MAG: hypothetical protein LUB59_03440 [Candidatus Gastranaerophilales bacterium]|nr:hypothetical protein [Candidatus Gastranaerophilales bacterium]
MGIKSIMGAQLGALSFRRTTTTNPFEHNSFRGKSFTGSVLPFADVFQAIKPVEAKPDKLKMISGAVIGAVSNFRTRITQPVINFANSVKETVLSGVNTFKSAGNTIAEMGKNVQNRVSHIFDSGKAAEETKEGVRVLSMKQINNKASVQDLKAAWIAENGNTVSNEIKSGKAAA